MADIKVYAFDVDANSYETLTREQIEAAIVQAIETGQIQNVDAGFITKIQEQNTKKTIKFWFGTQAEFNALETKENGTLYIFTDDPTLNDIENDFKAINEDLTNYKQATDDRLTNLEKAKYLHIVELKLTTQLTNGSAYTYNAGYFKTYIINNRQEPYTHLNDAGGLWDYYAKGNTEFAEFEIPVAFGFYFSFPATKLIVQTSNLELWNLQVSRILFNDSHEMSYETQKIPQSNQEISEFAINDTVIKI